MLLFYGNFLYNCDDVQHGCSVIICSESLWIMFHRGFLLKFLYDSEYKHKPYRVSVWFRNNQTISLTVGFSLFL